MFPPPKIPWQVTGNHWIAAPCVHPADGSIFGIGVVQRRLRGAVEFAGSPGFTDGAGEPFLKLGLAIDGQPVELGATPMAWQRVHEWIPTFQATIGDLVVRGTLVAPYGRDADLPVLIYAIAFENRGATERTITFTPHGVLGHRQLRVTTPRAFDDPHGFTVRDDIVMLSGASPYDASAFAIGTDGGAPFAARRADGAVEWSFAQDLVVAPGATIERAVYLAAAPERDGAAATLAAVRRRGWRALSESTRRSLAMLEQSTGTATADRLVNRHLMFAYFYAVARAIDDARLYLVRTRVPWNDHGVTVRDWDALMWTIPAVQVADPTLARELLVRMCEVHGYAPGTGVNYLDGTPFQPGFSIDGAAAYPVAVDRYIAQTGDDRIVEEPVISDTMYASYEDIAVHRHDTVALYATETTPSGAPTLPYTAHGNAIVAHALDIFRQILDEKTAEKVESGDLVRAALQRQFSAQEEGGRNALVLALDLAGLVSGSDDPVGSVYWLPVYEALTRGDPMYRRTVKRLASVSSAISIDCAKLIGPDAPVALDRLRRATMDNGLAAEVIDESGVVTGNGGDASLSGLIAYTVWYAVHVLGVRL